MRLLCFALICFAALMTLHAQQTDKLIHIVEAGETLISIANAYAVSLDQLLTLNSLDPDAYLQIGQRLLVQPDAVQADGGDAGQPASEQETSAVISTADHPAAPVTQASAPMMDPANLSPQLCFIIFADQNQNGMREPDEASLADGGITLFDAADVELLHYRTDGESEPFCLRDLARRLYRLEAAAPAGYGLSDGSSLWLDLRSGGNLNLEFGARSGFPAIPRSSLAANAAIEPAPSDEPRSLLREMSGLVTVGIASLVLISGLIAAVFLRGR